MSSNFSWTASIVTASITVIGGTLVFIAGQIFIVLFLERIRMQARVIEDIAKALVIHGRDYSTPIQLTEDTHEALLERLRLADTQMRMLAGTLRASAQTLKWYRFFSLLGLVLPRKTVIEASQNLIGLANSIPPREDMLQDITEFRKKVEQLLRIQITD